MSDDKPESSADLSRREFVTISVAASIAAAAASASAAEMPVSETMVDVTLGRRAADDLILAYDGGRLIGFSQHECARFGPFGVAADGRGRGIGAVLLFRTLGIMRRKGHHNAWFMWTDDATADRIYKSAGFRETRRYAVMKKTL